MDEVETLFALMRSRGWTQMDVAARLEISQGHLSRVLAGKSPVSPGLNRRIKQVFATEQPIDLRLMDSDLVNAMRNSRAFRMIVRAAMELLKAKKA